MNSRVNRRRFLKTSATLAGAAVLTPFDLAATGSKRTAVDAVSLGKTGIRLSRVGIGTGSNVIPARKDASVPVLVSCAFIIYR